MSKNLLVLLYFQSGIASNGGKESLQVTPTNGRSSPRCTPTPFDLMRDDVACSERYQLFWSRYFFHWVNWSRTRLIFRDPTCS